MQVYNDQPRPRVLIEDISEEIASRIANLTPTYRQVTIHHDVHEQEYEALFTAANLVRRKGHMCVVAYGSEHLGAIQQPDSADSSVPWGSATIRRFEQATLASELVVPSNITDELGELVRKYLVPFFSRMESKPALKVIGAASTSSQFLIAEGDNMTTWCTPFLCTGDGHVLAASFIRRGGGLCWALPPDCPVPELWAALALRYFREHDPSRFPALPAWWEQEEWATLDQHNARIRVTNLIVERERAIKDFDTRLIDARAAVDEADNAAAINQSRLLTADGESLVEAVSMVLELIGFEVRNMDHEFNDGRRREDLRVRDPDAPQWESIVEIKGYKRGAAVNDLARISRWGMLYASEHHGRLPSAMWHVVNSFRKMDPSARPTAIPNDEDLLDFTDDGGLLIDTRQLFRMQNDLERGKTTAGSLKTILRDGRGRLVLS